LRLRELHVDFPPRESDEEICNFASLLFTNLPNPTHATKNNPVNLFIVGYLNIS
jgi:hypothetical protein